MKVKELKQFNIFDYLDIKGMTKDLELDEDEDWILKKVDDRGTFIVRYKNE